MGGGDDGPRCKVCAGLLDEEDGKSKEHIEKSTRVVLGLLAHYSDTLMGVMRRGPKAMSGGASAMELKPLTEKGGRSGAPGSSSSSHGKDGKDGKGGKGKDGKDGGKGKEGELGEGEEDGEDVQCSPLMMGLIFLAVVIVGTISVAMSNPDCMSKLTGGNGGDAAKTTSTSSTSSASSSAAAAASSA